MLINLRNALMAGKRLPYDAEVEYIESTGTQWIDTGLTFDVSSVVDIALGITPTANAGDAFFYGLENLSSGNIGLELYRTDFYFAAGTSEQNLGAATIGARYDFLAHYESGNSWIKTNGTTTATLTNAFTRISNRSMFLFSRQTTTAQNTSKAKLYSFKVYKNSTLVRDFIPVRVGQVGYLYDRVSGKLFGNAGTGDFVLGQDVVPVEWLESDGYSYIQTNILPSAGLRTKLRWAFVRNPIVQNSSVFGSRSSGTSTDRYWLNYDGHFEFGYGNYHATNVTVLPLEVFDVDFNYIEDGDHKFKINNSAFTASGTPNTSVAIPLFGRIVDTTPSRQPSRGYYAEFIRDGVDVGKFLPVRVGTKGAMMDTLTRRIYRNAGTGAFTYGNDLKYPIPAS